MTRTRSVLASLVVFVLLSGTAACQRTDVPTNTPARAVGSTPQSTSVDYEQDHLVPFLNESGPPVACISEFWPHVMRDECMNEPGVPFEAELPLTLAIWRDGTVIWREGTAIWHVPPNGEKPEYFESELPQEAVSNLLAGIDLKEFGTSENVRYSDEAISNYCPASVIMVSKGETRLFLSSQLGAMELLQEYWVWEGSQQRTFPFSKYSFEDYCRQLPEAHSQHLREFKRVRAQLRAMLPTNGRRITVGDRVLWMVVAAGKSKDSRKTEFGLEDSSSTPDF